ncbi:MAG: hypothetical protein IPH54_15455 [Rhodoferax sp.]|nr:hypothetical protein [Rhodoferax sp.]
MKSSTEMGEYNHLTDAQWDLYSRMRQISEEDFCAPPHDPHHPPPPSPRFARNRLLARF